MSAASANTTIALATQVRFLSASCGRNVPYTISITVDFYQRFADARSDDGSHYWCHEALSRLMGSTMLPRSAIGTANLMNESTVALCKNHCFLLRIIGTLFYDIEDSKVWCTYGLVVGYVRYGGLCDRDRDSLVSAQILNEYIMMARLYSILYLTIL